MISFIGHLMSGRLCVSGIINSADCEVEPQRHDQVLQIINRNGLGAEVG